MARYARPVERMDFLRLSDGPELRALVYDVLFRLLGEGEHKIDVMLGLPVEVMADGEQARTTLRALRHWMIGRHVYAVNGTEVTLAVVDVQAMAQPAGAFFAWGLNDAGKWIRARVDLKAPVAVCDVGFNTLDLFSVQGGEVIGRFTSGDTAGMRRAAELIVNAVRGSHGLNPVAAGGRRAAAGKAPPAVHRRGGDRLGPTGQAGVGHDRRGGGVLRRATVGQRPAVPPPAVHRRRSGGAAPGAAGAVPARAGPARPGDGQCPGPGPLRGEDLQGVAGW